MSLKINWNDKRVSVIDGSQSIYLRTEDQKRIWSPRIAIATHMRSQKIEQAEFILRKKSEYLFDYANDNGAGAIATKYYIFSALVNCEMDFQHFPFDKHACNLEVRTPLSFQIYKPKISILITFSFLIE